MSLLKRLSTTLFSRIDQVVGEIENHDAIVQASIHDMRKQLAEAKVRLNQINREEARITNLIEEETKQLKLWQTRAINIAPSDENKALACVQRADQCQRHIAQLRKRQIQYNDSAEKLARDIETACHHIEEIKQKHQLMRARQSSANAMNAVHGHESTTLQQLDDSFERWEIKLSHSEMVFDDYLDATTSDSLERAFNQEEQQQALRNTLAELLASTNQEKQS